MSPEKPRVVRIRNLLGPEPLKPVAEVTDLELAIDGSHLTSDGKYLVALGLHGSAGPDAASLERLRGIDRQAPVVSPSQRQSQTRST